MYTHDQAPVFRVQFLSCSLCLLERPLSSHMYPLRVHVRLCTLLLTATSCPRASVHSLTHGYLLVHLLDRSHVYTRPGPCSSSTVPVHNAVVFCCLLVTSLRCITCISSTTYTFVSTVFSGETMTLAASIRNPRFFDLALELNS